ncbi:MAG: DUF2182 domain-containing protein [Actinobacteria bacterium]|nr:DUF2182 domain-containing protein [Actinomycetota bacterium]
MEALARPRVLAPLVLAAALAAWLVTVGRMRGMDEGPGSDLGGLGWYLGVWMTMMAAMMLPSVLPMVLLYARVARERSGAAPTWLFVGGYLAAWTAYGLLAYAASRGLRSLDAGVFAWDRVGPWLAGGAVAAAGLYELTPLKNACLRHCRTPLHFILHGWRTGRLGAVRMGGEHGLWCVGCCFGLMLALFALGVMSLFWMAAIGALIFAEKVLPVGGRLTRPLALAFVALGLWIALDPGSVPGFVEPGGMQMP